MSYEALDASAGTKTITPLLLNAPGVPIAPPIVTPGGNGQSQVTPRMAAFDVAAGSAFFNFATAFGLGSSSIGLLLANVTGGSTQATNSLHAIASSTPDITTTVVTVSRSDGATRSNPDIAFLPNGNAAVVWNEVSVGSVYWSIKGQVVTAAGATVGGEFSIATLVSQSQTLDRASVAALADGDCVAWISKRSRFGLVAASSRQADVFWASELQHPVQCVHGNCDLGRSAPVGSAA